MGQLNKTYDVIPEELKEIGKENLQACYSSEEIIAFFLDK